MENIEILKKNCEEYAKTSKSIEILRNANGKKHYTNIAEIVNIHKTKVSSLLKKAEKLGLAKKIKPGVYKKISGILGYMPRQNKTIKSSPKTVLNTIKKTSTKRRPNPPSFIVPGAISVKMNKMADAYRALYATENILRELIRKVLGSQKNWWKNRTPSGIQTNVKATIQELPYHATSRKDELEYTHLGELGQIIINKKNWNDFSPYLKTKDKTDFSATLNKAIEIRNAIGHCIPLKSEDLKFAEMRFKDIMKMLQS